MPDKYGVGQDPYCYVGSSILINALDLHSPEELELAEIELTSYRLSTFQPEFYNLTFQYLCQIHYHLFQDLYEWAGKVRTVDISKQSTHFCNVRFIEKSAMKCFDLLSEQSYLRNLSADQFVVGIADFFCEMNVVHPFREGNGRSLRLFCEVLALQAGYELTWQNVSQQSWLSANIAGYEGDLTQLIKIFKDVSRPIR